MNNNGNDPTNNVLYNHSQAAAVDTKMFSNLATKLALKKMGLPSDPLNFMTSSDPEPRKPKKLSKNAPPGTVPGLDDINDDKSTNWPAWMSVKSLPLAVQPWLTPMPPPIPVAEPPKVGDLAPLDRDRELTFGGGRMVLVVFLRCVGCACMFFSLSFTYFRITFIPKTSSQPSINIQTN